MHARRLTLLIVAALGLSACRADAAPVTLAELERIDALGFTCIDEDDLEAAFGALGKGGRVPQTCIADPCAAVLDQGAFGALLGRPAQSIEFVDYRGRMARFCGTPTFWAERGIGEDQLRAFVFDGPPIAGFGGGSDPQPAGQVPLPAGLVLLASALGCASATGLCTRRSRCCVV